MNTSNLVDYKQFYHHHQRDLFLYKLGQHYEAKGQINRALRCYQRALRHSKDNVIYKIKVANILADQNKFDDAISLIQSLLTIELDDSHIHSELASIFSKAGYIYEAINHLERAIKLDSKEPKYYLALADLFHRQGLIDEAISCYKVCLHYVPEDCICLNNLAIALKNNHQIDESIKHFQRALTICPHEPFIHFNYAHALLLSGDLREGFKEYEWRLKKHDYQQFIRDYNKPTWQGEAVGDKSILIYAEQGFGDTIQFFRYIRLLQKRGINVIFHCHRELKLLFKEVFEPIYSFEESLPDFDLQCPLLSLPYIFETELKTIPAEVPYLFSSSQKRQRWSHLIGDRDTIKIGLVWAGSPHHADDSNRSIDFSLLKPIISLKGFTFYSLQIGHRANQCKSSSKIIDLSAEIKDFSDTAALIDNLDLVITVDTAMAHLSGAMGKRTWLLLQYTPDWRWMLGMTHSPWYPTIRIFRQSKRGDWHGVIEEVVRGCMQLRY